MHIDATFFALVALIIFLAVAAYAGAFRSMGAGLDARAQRIQKDLDEAATLRKEAEALLAEYKQKRAAAEKEAEDIVAQAKASAEEYASETRRKLAESIERRTLQAEQKIAQAEATAIKDVRSAVADVAIAAAAALTAEQLKGGKGADLIVESIAAVRSRLN
ncbi:MAG: ATP F0F1 synthase subunit B [Alphaproteobacteria bacterium]|nr:ATP F0F1 synthase subunit B [Alphaproteobacteria bacterium]